MYGGNVTVGYVRKLRSDKDNDANRKRKTPIGVISQGARVRSSYHSRGRSLQGASVISTPTSSINIQSPSFFLIPRILSPSRHETATKQMHRLPLSWLVTLYRISLSPSAIVYISLERLISSWFAMGERHLRAIRSRRR